MIGNYKNIISFRLLILIIFFCSCQKDLLKEEFTNTPYGNFDAIWSEYDRNYGAFEAKNINWDSIKIVYRSQINEKSTDLVLYNVISGILANLNDGHVQLIAPGYKRFFSSPIRTLYPDSKYYENSTVINTLFSLVKTYYLTYEEEKGAFFYGNLISFKGFRKIGYLCVPSFGREFFPIDFIDSALMNFKSNDAIIVDLRFNGGGVTETFLSLLNRFADEKRLYLRSKLRDGPRHNDFTKIYEHYTWPEKNLVKNKRVAVLVNRFTGSSAEHFMLGMKSLPYVTIVGDTTYGALSTVIQKVLPNGWEYRMCPQVLLDSTGNYLKDSRGRYPDGIGLAPDVYEVNFYRDIERNRDYVLEKAIRVLNEN
jgi:carboxyl-terminal processing protease